MSPIIQLPRSILFKEGQNVRYMGKGVSTIFRIIRVWDGWEDGHVAVTNLELQVVK